MTPVFQTTGLSHSYGNFQALQDVTLETEPGAIGLVGQNGAGKSTLIKILLGMIRHTGGSVHVLGEEVLRGGVSLRGRIGYMPEREVLLPGLSGLEYVALAGELNGMPRKHSLRRAHETLSQLGLDEARSRKMETYSMGMAQRLKLAAALVHDPELLLLDEPTAGLDPDGRASMLALMKSLASRPGKSLILTTHLLGDIEKVCERAIILEQGKVALSGTINELVAGQRRAYRLSWTGNNGAGFLCSLRAEGLQVDDQFVHSSKGDSSSGEARALAPDSWSTRSFFSLAKQNNLLLTGLEPDEADLRSVYRRLIQNEPRHSEDNRGEALKSS